MKTRMEMEMELWMWIWTWMGSAMRRGSQRAESGPRGVVFKLI